MPWYCVYSKANHYNVIKKHLEPYSHIELFNPICEKKKIVRSKPKLVKEDLFPCYFFVSCKEIDVRMIRYTRGVRSIIGDCSGLPYAMEDCFIDNLKGKHLDGAIPLVEPQFASGENVKIISGSFKGLEAKILECSNGKERVSILLNILSGQVKATLSVNHLEKHAHT